MEMKIEQVLPTWKKQQEQLTLHSQCSTPVVNSKTTEIAAYQGTPASQEEIKVELLKLKARYPKMELDHLALLAQDLAEENMSTEQLKATLKHFVKNHKFQTFTLADILDQQPKIKFYTPSEVLQLTGQTPSPQYPTVKFDYPNGSVYKYVSRDDAIEYNLNVYNWNDEYNKL
jgi:hypothetical protein